MIWKQIHDHDDQYEAGGECRLGIVFEESSTPLARRGTTRKGVRHLQVWLIQEAEKVAAKAAASSSRRQARPLPGARQEQQEDRRQGGRGGAGSSTGRRLRYGRRRWNCR